MLFRLYALAPPLRDFIENFWLYEGYPSPHWKERIFPGDDFEVVYNLQNDECRIYDSGQPLQYQRFSGALLSRPSSTPFVTDSAEEASVLGVNFKLGGAFPFLGFPSGERGDAHMELKDVWGPETVELQERLAAASRVRNRFRLLEKALLAQLSRGTQHHPAVLVALRMLERPGAVSRTRDIARSVELSERRFIELFQVPLFPIPDLLIGVGSACERDLSPRSTGTVAVASVQERI
jgi:hypothetical protein